MKEGEKTLIGGRWGRKVKEEQRGERRREIKEKGERGKRGNEK